MRTHTTAALAAALVLLAACGSAAPETGPAPAPAAATRAPADSSTAAGRPRFSRDVLTEAEIQQANIVTSAYEAVTRLRPQWLRMRGTTAVPEDDGTREIQVWYNGRKLGNPETLRDITITQIVEMRWVDPIQARQRYGPGNARGVIAINGR
ncbi:MAG TPA: hypothetical protein VM890_01995 [Longimicrobium sp.]|jgi:hypothetical protein|nr:hypothetical protein [Longimicrobium sp.]